MTHKTKRNCAIGIFAVLAALLLISNFAAAQTRDLGAIKGHVRDAQGKPVEGVEIKLENKSIGFERTTKTDAQGNYSFSGLPLTGKYDLTARAENFALVERKDIQLQGDGTASVDLSLAVGGVQAGITVNGTAEEGVSTDSNQVSSRLDLPKIENTPILNNKLTSLALLDSSVRPSQTTGDLFTNETLFVINGGGRRNTTISLDNTSADDSWGRQTIFTTLPFASVQEFNILTNASSAEYGRTSGSAINIVTKSGTNNYHGDFIGMGRPSFSEASLPLVALGLKGENTLSEGSGAFSGPLVKDRTHFLISAEYNNQNRDAVITSPLIPGSIFTGNFGQTLFLARVDHQLSNHNLLTIRANFDLFADTNPQDGVSGNNLPSTARTFSRRTYAAALSLTSTISPHVVNEFRTQWQLASPITNFLPANPGPQLAQAGIFTYGDSRFANLMNHQYEQADTVNIVRGNHSLKFGVDLIESSSGGFGQEFGTGFLFGQFTIDPAACVSLSATSIKPATCAAAATPIPIPNLTIANVTRFTQTFGNQAYNLKETLWAVFLQDNWTVRPGLTLNLGLRYEDQTFTSDHNNIAPRIGLAWLLPNTKSTVIRAGYGIYYSEIRTDLAAGYLLGGPTGLFTFSAAPGQCGFPSSITPWASLAALFASSSCSVAGQVPARTITIPLGASATLSPFFNIAGLPFYPARLINPYTQQWNLGIEHELFRGWVLSLDYVGSHALKLERPTDLNTPTPFVRTAAGQTRSVAVANLTRPIQPTGACTTASANFISSIGNCFNNYTGIMAIVNVGSGSYNGLQIKLNKRFSHHISMLMSYTYSHAIGTVEPDAAIQNANDWNFLGAAEKGTSVLDQRHRAALSGWYDLPWGFTFGAGAALGSGFPFNATTGVDNNGDGVVADRPFVNGAVVPRNWGQGTPIYDTNLSLQKAFNLGERLRISVRADTFNIFNHTNLYGRNGTFGNGVSPNATFGAPIGGIANVGPPRAMQFMMRIQF